MEIQLVAAVSRTGCLGRDGSVPWHYPADRAQYERRIRDTTVVVGRRTFDGMAPAGRTLVLTGDETRTENPRVTYVTSREAAVEHAQTADADRVSVIGGAATYQTFAPIADRAFVSELPETLDGDAYFPYLGAGWTVVDRVAYDAFELVEYENTTPDAR